MEIRRKSEVRKPNRGRKARRRGGDALKGLQKNGSAIIPAGVGSAFGIRFSFVPSDFGSRIFSASDFKLRSSSQHDPPNYPSFPS